MKSKDISALNNRLDQVDQLLDGILSDTRAQVVNQHGDFIDQALDDRQLLIYQLVMCHADLSAARALTSYADQVRTSDQDLGYLSALGFMDEMLGQLRYRLTTCVSQQSKFQSLIEAATVPLTEALSASSLAELGRAYSLLGGDLGEDCLPDVQKLIRESFRKFSDDVVAPEAESIHRENRTVPDKIIEGLKELGCFGLSIPQRYGGLLADNEGDCLGLLIATEELSRVSLGAAGSLITRPEIMARALLSGGTEAQKQKWLPQLAAGEPLCAVSVTEPGTGSDVASVSLKATKTEQGWCLNGTKTWCTLAGKAGVVMVLARTEANPELGHKGLSLFLVEKPPTDAGHFEIKQAGGGLLSGRSIPTLGYRGMHSFDMFYDNYLVPDINLIGEEGGRGKGFYFTMEGFSGGRIQTAARACGLMRGAYEAALRQAENRQVFGQKLGDYQLTLCKIAKMAIHILACRQFTYDTGRLLDEGNGQTDASLVKIFSCRTAEWVTREAMQIHGGIGYAEESAVSRYWADARVLSIFEGAEEVLALRVVGRHLLKSAR